MANINDVLKALEAVRAEADKVVAEAFNAQLDRDNAALYIKIQDHARAARALHLRVRLYRNSLEDRNRG